jgi:hypothetical protein
MESTGQNQMMKNGMIWSFLFHISFIGVTIFLVVIRLLPLLMNPELGYGADEVFHAREIWEYLQGRNLFFYYENVNYHGTFEGYTAIPFVKYFGFYPLPFKLPALIYYGLFIWSSFLIVRTINLGASWIVSIFLVFPPQWLVSWALLHNYVFAPILFLGNMTLYFFIKFKTDNAVRKETVFLLCFFSGLAIYIFTYSIIYIFTILFLLALTYPKWDMFRDKISIKILLQSFVLLETKKEKVAKIYDILLCVFLLAIAYSYIFGGFGLDIGGFTILQINNLHKPVLQVIPLIVIRLLLARLKVLPSIFNPFKNVPVFDGAYKTLISVGAFGFALGISPRVISILNGSVARGGQGFDMDFSPLRILLHTLELVCFFPHIVGVKFEYLFSHSSNRVFPLLQDIFTLPIMGLIIYSLYFFLRKNWAEIKSLIMLKGLSFSPSLVLLILPASLCVSLVVTMNGPKDHYLMPLYWVLTVYVALFVSDTIQRSRILGATFIGIWIIFFSITFNYSLHELPKFKDPLVSYDKEALKALLSRSQQKYIDLIETLSSKKINAVYAGYALSSNLIINSEGSISAAEYSSSGRSKRLRKNLESYPDFGLVLKETYQNNDKDPLSPFEKFSKFLNQNEIRFKQEKVSGYVILWDFVGDVNMKNRLRTLID